MTKVIKNNKGYDSGDVEVFINGQLTSVSQIEYGTEQEHQLNYSLANEPTSWSRGKKSYSATITMLMEDVVVLEQAAKGDLLSVKPFDINVSYVNEFNDLVNDTITAKFKNQGREVTGDMGLNKQYELFVLNIKYLSQ